MSEDCSFDIVVSSEEVIKYILAEMTWIDCEEKDLLKTMDPLTCHNLMTEKRHRAWAFSEILNYIYDHPEVNPSDRIEQFGIINRSLYDSCDDKESEQALAVKELYSAAYDLLEDLGTEKFYKVILGGEECERKRS